MGICRSADLETVDVADVLGDREIDDWRRVLTDVIYAGVRYDANDLIPVLIIVHVGEIHADWVAVANVALCKGLVDDCDLGC